ncbi:MAG: NTP transferase domain-containing protein, partial [Brachymonas sp.]|nr:NTP transferase domain-containing protein [Brachymonas sp.]
MSTHLPLDIVIMAAGKGTRMKSATPKVLQQLAHQGLVQHVLDTAAQLQARQVVVITGHGAEQVEAALAQTDGTAPKRQFVRQMPQLGTGHAVQQAVPVLADDGIVVVLSGDVPLTQADTIEALVQQCGGTQLALLTLKMANPFGYGRIIRNAAGQVQRIVEQKDGTVEELAVDEIYSGILAAP